MLNCYILSNHELNRFNENLLKTKTFYRLLLFLNLLILLPYNYFLTCSFISYGSPYGKIIRETVE